MKLSLNIRLHHDIFCSQSHLSEMSKDAPIHNLLAGEYSINSKLPPHSQDHRLQGATHISL